MRYIVLYKWDPVICRGWYQEPFKGPWYKWTYISMEKDTAIREQGYIAEHYSGVETCIFPAIEKEV